MHAWRQYVLPVIGSSLTPDSRRDSTSSGSVVREARRTAIITAERIFWSQNTDALFDAFHSELGIFGQNECKCTYGKELADEGYLC